MKVCGIFLFKLSDTYIYTYDWQECTHGELQVNTRMTFPIASSLHYLGFTCSPLWFHKTKNAYVYCDTREISDTLQPPAFFILKRKYYIHSTSPEKNRNTVRIVHKPLTIDSMLSESRISNEWHRFLARFLHQSITYSLCGVPILKYWQSYLDDIGVFCFILQQYLSDVYANNIIVYIYISDSSITHVTIRRCCYFWTCLRTTWIESGVFARRWEKKFISTM